MIGCGTIQRLCWSKDAVAKGWGSEFFEARGKIIMIINKLVSLNTYMGNTNQDWKVFGTVCTDFEWFSALGYLETFNKFCLWFLIPFVSIYWHEY